jgi:hypothetical protein
MENVEELADIAGRLSRVAVEAGPSWELVGERLRMPAHAARRTFAEP